MIGIACAQVPVIINDRVDVALAAGADGVHVGQDDLPAALVRQLIGPDAILGVSCKTVEQARKAAADGADYLGVGAGMRKSRFTCAHTLTCLPASTLDWKAQRLALAQILAVLFLCKRVYLKLWSSHSCMTGRQALSMLIL